MDEDHRGKVIEYSQLRMIWVKVILWKWVNENDIVKVNERKWVDEFLKIYLMKLHHFFQKYIKVLNFFLFSLKRFFLVLVIKKTSEFKTFWVLL